jgi:amino acid transporter
MGALTSGSVGLAGLYGVAVFVGFEATAMFRNEVKYLDKRMPRARYLAVILIGHAWKR